MPSAVVAEWSGAHRRGAVPGASRRDGAARDSGRRGRGGAGASGAEARCCHFRAFAAFGRGLFQAGDLHFPLGHTAGGGESAKRGSHSYPQRSHRYAVTVFEKIAMRKVPNSTLIDKNLPSR
jgi:hypothetical protein